MNESNKAKIAAKLAEAFAGIKPRFLELVKSQMKNAADSQHKAWGERLTAGPVKGNWRMNEPGRLVKQTWPKAWDSGVYDLLSKGTDVDDPATRARLDWDNPLRAMLEKARNRFHDHPDAWAAKTALFAAGLYAPDYKRAEQEAIDYVDSVEEHFVAKQSRKIANACGSRAVVKLDGSLTVAGIVTGTLGVTVKGGDSFSVAMDIITNYRYGCHSINGKLTVYAQYPARFKAVRLAGQVKKSAGEKWMAENFAAAVAQS